MKALILVLSIFFFFTVPAKALEVEDVKENLEEIGVEEEYRDNIETYLNNMTISEKDINNIEEEAKEVMGSVQNKNSISDFSLKEIWKLYKKAKEVAEDLNLGFNFSIANKSFAIKDKSNNNVLLEGNINDLQSYYDKYTAILNNKALENYEAAENHSKINISEEKNNEKENEVKPEEENEKENSYLQQNTSQNTMGDEESKINDNKINAIDNKASEVSSDLAASKKLSSSKFSLIVAGIFTIGTLGILKVLKKV